MTNAKKIAAYKDVYESLSGVEFGKKNLVLSKLAASLGLRHCFDAGNFELYTRRSRNPALVVAQ